MATSKGDNLVPGLTMLGCFLCGVGALIAAAICAANEDLGEAGICLIAAALAFGLLSNALLRE